MAQSNLWGRRLFRLALCFCGLQILYGCAMSLDPETQSLRRDIAQKLMLDFRYFCPQQRDEEPCREPMTVLPDDVAKMISQTGVGGVILFSENLATPDQTASLTTSLQNAAMAAEDPQPLFIAVDQEGGRVFRTPRVATTDFPGNMAIGATYEKYGTRYATVTGKILAQELRWLGINTNFAPDVDVNVNLANPVINVRAFGQSPEMVAQLGEAQVKAMQDQNVLATIKHFPGHGDTETDSHLALPVVTHDRETVDAVDLYPFKYIIETTSPAMVMTAHIQYPELDDSTLIDNNGNPQIKPATLSQRILTGILREELGYEGLIVSDAMNMAGIAHFFAQSDAVAESFAAGADVTVMPLPVHSPSDIKKFNELLDTLVEKVKSGELDKDMITASAQRVRETKERFHLAEWPAPDTQALANALYKHKEMAKSLADDAVTLIKGAPEALKVGENQRLLMLMPEETLCYAASYHLSLYRPDQPAQCLNLQDVSENELTTAINAADVVLLGSLTPSPSVVELGGMEDLAANQRAVMGFADVQAMLPELLLQARNANKKTMLAYLRMPYDNSNLYKLSDVVLATYNSNVYPLSSQDGEKRYTGASIDSLISVLAGLLKPQGTLPVKPDYD